MWDKVREWLSAVIGWCVMLTVVAIFFLSWTDIETGIPLIDGASYSVGFILGLCLLIGCLVVPLWYAWEGFKRRDWGKVIGFVLGFFFFSLVIVALLRGAFI